MAVEFVTIDRDTPYLFPPSVQDHLAQFETEIVDQVDLSGLLGVYAGKGKKPCHPSMLVALLFFGYATGTFSRHKLDNASPPRIGATVHIPVTLGLESPLE